MAQLGQLPGARPEIDNACARWKIQNLQHARRVCSFALAQPPVGQQIHALCVQCFFVAHGQMAMAAETPTPTSVPVVAPSDAFAC